MTKEPKGIQEEPKSNQEEPKGQIVQAKPPKEIRVVNDSGPLANLFDTARFEHCFRIAEAMSFSTLIPEHLRGNKHRAFTPPEVKSNCFLIVNQALRWNMDPFAVMPESYVVGGKLAYQGKLVAAVVNARAPLRERLKYSYTGKKGSDDFTITVSGTFLGEEQPRIVTLSVGEAKTENQMWRKDPEQKLVYSGAVRWARRWTPELVLGVLTDDDIDRMESWRLDAAKQAKVSNSIPNFEQKHEVTFPPHEEVPPQEERPAEASELLDAKWLEEKK